MTVYVDLVMGLNFLVDFLLLLGTNRLSGFPAEGGRAAIASVLGAAYSGACLVPGFRFLGNTFWRLVSLGLMGSVAFGWDRSAIRRGGVFVLLSMALGGVALGMGNRTLPMLLMAAGAVWLLCRVGFPEGMGREYIPLVIRHEGREVNLLALRDTGNTLRDPISGDPVLVLGSDAARQLCGLERDQLMHPMQTVLQLPGFRLVPYRAVGQPGSMLLARRFDCVKLGKHSISAVVAFAPDTIGGGSYQALAY